MNILFRRILSSLGFAIALAPPTLSAQHTLTISNQRFYLNDQPFPYTGISFFNGIYNRAFNESSPARKAWLAKFQKYGVNVLRVWAQWDNKRGFVDAGPGKTLYHSDGSLREEHVRTLKAIVADADELGVVVQVVLFSQESWREGVRLTPEAEDRAVAGIARELLPYRNVVIQIWNEFSQRVLEHVKTVRSVDPQRIVTNSPGGAGYLGDPSQNNALDYLTPHTSRQNAGRTWEIAPQEVEYLLTRYRKPVVDDEPARNGTQSFGGPKTGTSPYDHIVQIQKMWQLGAYICYHHDMFQTGYGTPACPPHGIPDPEFSPYHRQVFEFLALRERFMLPETHPHRAAGSPQPPTTMDAWAPFPNPNWPVMPDTDLDAATRVRQAAYRQWCEQRGGDSWASVVIQRGRMIFEGCGPRATVHQKHDCGSILKPLQATVLGAALQQKKLASLDEPALQHWKDAWDTPFENDRAITFREFASYRDRWNDPEPAGVFRYNNAGATAAGACIAGLFGNVRGHRPVGIAEAARREVAGPIGADWDLWYWQQDFVAGKPGNPGPRMVLEASAVELAKLGYLWLRRGVWNGRRIFSEEYYREAVTDWSPNTRSRNNGYVGHYGYWWFVNQDRALLPDAPEDAFYHIGNGHPKRATGLLVIPSLDAVAVLGMERLSDNKLWDVVQNSRAPDNAGMRHWSSAVLSLLAALQQSPRSGELHR